MTSLLYFIPSNIIITPPVNLSKNEANNTNIDRSRNTVKKAKVDRFRSNSTSKTAEKLSAGLKPIEDLFSNNPPTSLCQFKYVMENYSNKIINIYIIRKDIVDITSLMHLIDQIRPKVTERITKSQLTRLVNFLFQALPLSQNNYFFPTIMCSQSTSSTKSTVHNLINAQTQIFK